jgi:hypothetical protein
MKPTPTYRQLVFAYAKRLAFVLVFGVILNHVVTSTSLSPIAWFSSDPDALGDAFNANAESYGAIIGIYFGLHLCGMLIKYTKDSLENSPYWDAKQAYLRTLRGLTKLEKKARLKAWKAAYTPIFDEMNRMELQRGLAVNPDRVFNAVLINSLRVVSVCFSVQFVYSVLNPAIANVVMGGCFGIYLAFVMLGEVIDAAIPDEEPTPALTALPDVSALILESAEIPADQPEHLLQGAA